MTDKISTTAKLIEQGYLVPTKLFVRPAVLEHELHAGSVVEAYQSTCAGKRVIVYANTVVHAEYLAAQFNSVGILAYAVLARDNHAVRTAAMESFSAGTCMVLITINIDLSPAKADGVIIATPHNSARRYEGQIVSAMSPRFAPRQDDTDAMRRAAIAGSAKPVAMIIDLADNYLRHPDVIASVTHRAKPDNHLTIPGSLEWDQAPEVVAVVGQTDHASPETDVIHMPGIDSLPVGTELVDRAHVTRLQAELAALREELARRPSEIAMSLQTKNKDLQKRLADAERRNATLAEAMERIHFRCESFNDEALGMKKHSVRVMLDIAAKALDKPTESGASE